MSARQQLLVERAPVGADAHRLAVADRGLDDLAELPVALVLEADVAGVDAVLVERLGAGWMVGEQLVADIVEVADQRHVDAPRREPVADVRDGGGGLVAIDGDAHELGARARERGDLAAVASTSAVSVLVIDWTTIGAPPPTMTAAWPLADADADGLAPGQRAEGRLHSGRNSSVHPRVNRGSIRRGGFVTQIRPLPSPQLHRNAI